MFPMPATTCWFCSASPSGSVGSAFRNRRTRSCGSRRRQGGPGPAGARHPTAGTGPAHSIASPRGHLHGGRATAGPPRPRRRRPPASARSCADGCARRRRLRIAAGGSFRPPRRIRARARRPRRRRRSPVPADAGSSPRCVARRAAEAGRLRGAGCRLPASTLRGYVPPACVPCWKPPSVVTTRLRCAARDSAGSAAVPAGASRRRRTCGPRARRDGPGARHRPGPRTDEDRREPDERLALQERDDRVQGVACEVDEREQPARSPKASLWIPNGAVTTSNSVTTAAPSTVATTDLRPSCSQYTSSRWNTSANSSSTRAAPKPKAIAARRPRLGSGSSRSRSSRR